VNANEVELKLPLQAAQPGAMTLLVTQYGASQPLPVSRCAPLPRPDTSTVSRFMPEMRTAS
jgi:hypothetical protein